MPTHLQRIRDTAKDTTAKLRQKDLEILAGFVQDAAEIAHLRVEQCLSFKEIAVKLGRSVDDIETTLVKARKHGLLCTQDEIAGLMKNRLVPKAMDVLGEKLNADSEESAIATLKGAGVLVSHQRSQAVNETNTTLRVIVENRDGSPIKALDPLTMTGQIVGVGNPDDEEASVIRKGV